MAFFGLTQLGYQNTIREGVRYPQHTPREVQMLTTRSYTLPYLQLDKTPPACRQPPSSASPSIVPINQTSGYGSGPNGSYVDFTRLRMKHIRKPTDPVDAYRIPLNTSQQYGWWMRESPLKQRQPWVHVPRKTHKNSPMTKFVDEMYLTNREFSLF